MVYKEFYYFLCSKQATHRNDYAVGALLLYIRLYGRVSLDTILNQPQTSKIIAFLEEYPAKISYKIRKQSVIITITDCFLAGALGLELP
jgi:hypothetical protein